MLVAQTGFDIKISNLKDALEFADTVAKSDFVPAAFKGKPTSVMLAMQMGAELGLKPLQSLQNIAVINGRPSIWGDASLALVKVCPDFEYIKETVSDTEAVCAVKAKNQPEHTVKFTMEDAKKAGLWGKSGPWTQYPKRMLQMRARGFALRDVFPHVLKGLILAEEAEDYPEHITREERAAELYNVIENYDDAPETTQENPVESAEFKELFELLSNAASFTQLNDVAKRISNSSASDLEKTLLRDLYKNKRNELKEAENETN